MKKLLFLITLIAAVNTVSAQYVYTIKADSVKITNHCDTAELIIENHTQNVRGFLFNKWKGRTEFRRVQKLNDSSLVFGDDTLSVRGNIQANNGLGIFGGKIQLGQPVGEAGNPAQLLNNREVPLNGFGIDFTNTGRSISLKNSEVSILGDTAKLTLIESSLQKYLSIKTTPDYSVIGTGTPLMYLFPDGGFLLKFDTTAPIDPRNNNAQINGNLKIKTDLSLGWDNGLYIENDTELGSYSGGQVMIYSTHEYTGANQRMGTIDFGVGRPSQFYYGARIQGISAGAVTEDHEGGVRVPAHITFETGMGVGTYERMRIAGEGNIGIGTTDPQKTLHIHGTTLVSGSEAMGNPGTLSIGDVSDPFIGFSISRSPYYQNTNISFGDPNVMTEQMTFFDSRNIAIGPYYIGDLGQKFQVNGTGIFTDTLTATTMGNADNSDRVATTAFVKNVMSLPAIPIVSSGTSDYIATTGNMVKLADLTGAGSHSVTLPSASTHSGQRILIWNMNNSGNSWTFSSSVTLPDGTTSNTIANQTTIELISDGSVWLKWK